MKAKMGFWFFSSAAVFALSIMFRDWLNVGAALFVGLSSCNVFKYFRQRK